MRCPNCRFDSFGESCQFCGWNPQSSNSSCSNCGFLTSVYESRIGNDYVSKKELKEWIEDEILNPSFTGTSVLQQILDKFCS